MEKFDIRFKTKLAIQKTKAKVKDKTEQVKQWAKDHPNGVIAVVTVGIPAAYSLGREINKAVKNHQEEERRKLETYDHRTDTWLQLRRRMTAAENQQLAQRMSAGESKTMILMDMGLLK